MDLCNRKGCNESERRGVQKKCLFKRIGETWLIGELYASWPSNSGSIRGVALSRASNEIVPY